MRAFLKFAGRRDVTALHAVEQALGVPTKRFERPMLGFLSRAEMMAVIGRPDGTWTSQRDHLPLRMLCNTGARVSEIIGVTVADVVLDGVAFVLLHGKGRMTLTAAGTARQSSRDRFPTHALSAGEAAPQVALGSNDRGQRQLHRALATARLC